MAEPINVDQREVRNLEHHPDVLAALENLGGQIARTAEEKAPKQTGRGAASITYELYSDETGPSVRVSWDKDRFYMRFHELGTSKMRARPFLRPALDRHYTI